MNYTNGHEKSRAPRIRVGAIRARAQHERIPREQDPWFLNRALQFNPDLACVAVTRLVKESWKRRPYKLARLERDCSALVANLVQAYGPTHRKRSQRPVAISRNVNAWYVDARYGLPSERIVDLMNALLERGLIEMTPGYKPKRGPGRKSRIWATADLFKLYPELAPGVVLRPPHELVELRKWGTRDLLPYQDTAFTRDCRQTLQMLNDVNGKAEMVYTDGEDWYDVLSYAKAVFLDNFNLYGRLHTTGGRRYGHHAQGVKKSHRASILIDRQPVVELDYSSLHVRILYAEEGVQFPFDQEAYLQVIDAIPGMRAARYTPPQRRLMRRYFKTLLLAVLNAPDRTVAQQAGNAWRTDHRAELAEADLRLAKAKVYLPYFERVHKPIAKYFYSGIGMTLMNRDARMALDIVRHFAEQKRPILTLHDGFIVQQKYRDELRETMQTVFRRHNHNFRCPISSPSDAASSVARKQ